MSDKDGVKPEEKNEQPNEDTKLLDKEKDEENTNKDDKPKDDGKKEEDNNAMAALDPTAAMTPEDDADNFREPENRPIYSQACCCICHCSDQLTEGATCCFIVPLKAGITFIAVLTVVLIAVQISQQFFLMLNDQVKWWYPFVNVCLYLPTYTGASFFVVWLGKDNITNRGRLFCGCILVVISTSLVAAWAVIYFVWIYKQEFVYYGWGTPESGYLKFQKKYYVFRELLYAVILLTLYSYFICVTLRYRDLLRQEMSAEDKAAHKDE
jgi:hypothetical protein